MMESEMRSKFLATMLLLYACMHNDGKTIFYFMP